jgi:hypothetical protein
MEEQLIIEIWDLFKEYIPAKNMDIAANHFVDFLSDHDVGTGVLASLQGMDSHLDDAIKALIREEEGFEEAEEDDDYSEDEEY